MFVPDPDEPYAAATREVGQRFRLKVSWASVHARADTLVIDVQYWDGSQYITMQHSTYGPDILAAARAANGTLGPEQWLYSPDLGRALRYQCQLSRATP
ncbi:MAG: hypothetical protein QM527_05910 [Alphaproteobacteria bacterium]|nr:hypothetical protein [Alphaproteobacteria bacterium]